nr:MAG TPA: hypothetical protein [Caudoviricetes sp.]
MEKQWIEKLNNEHVLFYDYINENVCFSSIDYMSNVIKKIIRMQPLKLNCV